MPSWPKVSKREVRMRVLYMDFSLNKNTRKEYKREYKSEEAKSPNEGTIV